MSETLVLCGDVPAPKRAHPNILQLDAHPDGDPRHRIGLELDVIAKPFVDNVPDVLCDLLEFAAYIYTADRLLSRGTNLMTNMGADWRRKIKFRIAVRCPEIWSRPEIEDALADTLNFISEDEISFDFLGTQRTTGISPYFGFSEPNAQMITPDDVILFSGGVDSTAGVVERLIGEGKRVALVTHRSSKLLAGRQDELVAAFRERARKRSLFHLPIWVTKGDQEPIEFTQRSRSLLFAVLGIVVARMFNKQEILFFENGITSFNLPIAEHVLGTRTSRTTHPRVFRRLEQLFSRLLDVQIRIHNPYLWSTKREIVGVLARHGCVDLITRTLSCANVRNLPMTNKQCGVCSQCIERRFAILAAGFDQQEPAQGYAVDLFRGAHTRVEHITMAECHVLRAQKLASMSEIAFLATYGQVFRALSDLPGSPSDNARGIYKLHRQYGQYVIDVIDDELKRNASLTEALALAETSLLAMINAPVGLSPVYMDPIEQEPRPSLEASLDNRLVEQRRFTFAIDSHARRILFADGPRLKGASYSLIVKLGEQFRRDIESGTPKNRFAFVPTKELIRNFGIDDSTFRRRVRQARLSLEQQFVKCIDYLIDEHDVIQSHQWQGYRLNPHLLLVDAAQLRADSAGFDKPVASHNNSDKSHDSEPKR